MARHRRENTFSNAPKFTRRYDKRPRTLSCPAGCAGLRGVFPNFLADAADRTQLKSRIAGLYSGDLLL